MATGLLAVLALGAAELTTGSDGAAPGSARLAAQGRGGGAGAQAPQSARAAAPRDFTGYWVAVVTEHWHLRMRMPPKGDYSMLPLNAEARKIADAWDPARDRADGGECRAYGAPGLMKIPGRLHIHWVDDNTLQVDADSGTQTRRFRFGNAQVPAGTAADWQGYSVATWGGRGVRGRGAPAPQNHLRVVTTNLRPGYLRKNGVPYSENARLEEFFETFTEPNGDTWLVVTSIVTDPRYLTQPYAVTYPFKKIPDRQGWDPTPCRIDEPR
jgi:hypothetical protein